MIQRGAENLGFHNVLQITFFENSIVILVPKSTKNKWKKEIKLYCQDTDLSSAIHLFHYQQIFESTTERFILIIDECYNLLKKAMIQEK